MDKITDQTKAGKIKERMYSLRNFTIDWSDFERLSTLGNDKSALTLITDGKGLPKPISRLSTTSTMDADFSNSGILFFVPNITDSGKNNDEERLRAAKTLLEKWISFSFTCTDTSGAEDQIVKGFANVTAKDFSETANVFFGDRPLNSPGYSEFNLKGGVQSGSSANDLLDVYRVEQRLKYFGFPAIGTGTGNTLKDFDVDGKFADKEKAALKLFEKVVRYQEDGPATHFTPDSPGADGLIESGNSGQAKITKDWLSAYNAPHWMQLFEETGNAIGESTGTENSPKFRASSDQLPGWRSSQTGTRVGNVELFGASWFRDLMRAKNYAPAQLRQANSLFNGTVDANLKFTPAALGLGGHQTHDLGMALDLGISQYISKEYLNPLWDRTWSGKLHNGIKKWLPGNQDDTAALTAAQTIEQLIPANRGWSIARALAWSNEPNLPVLPNDLGINNQQAALKDFLSLYAVTRDDYGLSPGDFGPPNPNPTAGSRGSLPIENGGAQKEEIRNALFGDGTKDGGLISNVLIGWSGYNTYQNIRTVLTNLGINNRTAPPHKDHFHIYLRPPKLLEIGGKSHQGFRTRTS